MVVDDLILVETMGTDGIVFVSLHFVEPKADDDFFLVEAKVRYDLLFG